MSFFGELKRRNVLRVEVTGPCQQKRAAAESLGRQQFPLPVQWLEGVIKIGCFR